MEPGRQEEVEEDSGRSALGRSTLLLAALQQLPHKLKMSPVTSVNKGCCNHQDSAATPARVVHPEETQDEKEQDTGPRQGRCTLKEL